MNTGSLLYKLIDDILWTDWDPMAINNTGPRDEYQMYVAKIVSLVESGADREAIANKLYKFETDSMGMDGSIEHCSMVANKILKIFTDFNKSKSH